MRTSGTLDLVLTIPKRKGSKMLDNSPPGSAFRAAQEVGGTASANVQDVFSLPMVLRSKQRKLHTAIFQELANALKPLDAVEWMYVRDCADARFKIAWFRD